MKPNKEEIRLLNAILFDMPANTIEPFWISKLLYEKYPNAEKQLSGAEFLIGLDHKSKQELSDIAFNIHKFLLKNTFIKFNNQNLNMHETPIVVLTERGLTLRNSGSYESYLFPDGIENTINAQRKRIDMVGMLGAIIGLYSVFQGVESLKNLVTDMLPEYEYEIRKNIIVGVTISAFLLGFISVLLVVFYILRRSDITVGSNKEK